MAKNGKVDPCSANHTNCNITYFLIKFSGYIAYEMQFNILYGFIRLFIYEYLIFTFISGVFLQNSQNIGKSGVNTPKIDDYFLVTGRAHTPKIEVFSSHDLILPIYRACSN